MGGPIDRREFLALSAAAAALAGIGGCSPRSVSVGEIVPYVRKPEPLVPGRPLHYATTAELNGVGIGLVVESREGRPLKVEGNPAHPGSLGATDAYAQALLFGLYDPDRSKEVRHRGVPASWDDALAVLRSAARATRQDRGAGVRLLTGSTSSPSLLARLAALLHDLPEARWVRYEPLGRDAAAEGARRAFGEALNPVYDLRVADVIVALDSDFLACGPGSVRYQREFADRRRVRVSSEGGVLPSGMSRLYAVESMLTATGVCADHRLAMPPSRVESFARALAAELGVKGAPPPGPLPEGARAWIAPLARDLRAHSARCLILAGDGQPASLHALAHAINETLGNIGQTVRFTDSLDSVAGIEPQPFDALVGDMAAGRVALLLNIGTNPVYTAPADLNFRAALTRVKLSAHLGLYCDETGATCDWHIPEAHELESWGDARAYDGTVGLRQPLIEPLYGGQSAVELLSAVFGGTRVSGREALREYWRQAGRYDGDFEVFWEEALREGMVPGSVFPTKSVALRPDWAKGSPEATAESAALEVQFLADPTLHDGRFANNGWLQELPKPVTKLTWGNAALISPKTANELQVGSGTEAPGGEHGHGEADEVTLTYRGRSVRGPVWVVPGHADGVVTLLLGHGRERAGRIGSGVGFDAYRLRTSDVPGFGHGLDVRRTGRRLTLACTQVHHAMNYSEPVRVRTAGETGDDVRPYLPAVEEAVEKAAVTALDPPVGSSSEGVRDPRLIPLTLYPEWPYEDRRWGMSIDLSTCTGCSVCVVACQAENNIPVVGKTEVVRGREMHWLRVDRYEVGGEQGRPACQVFQPVPCMHCENAPCELVCPTGATVHSHDGLNDMIYNRCIGTRYCSNNCPYKVRRFNFLAYADFGNEALDLAHNPEVSVRSRGVMEKCTYCVQRIRNAERDAETLGRPIGDGWPQTACQQACPSRAISFGDLNERASEVVRWKAEPHDYGLLAELNTQPRTTYLAAFRNPNPEMPQGA